MVIVKAPFPLVAAFFAAGEASAVDAEKSREGQAVYRGNRAAGLAGSRYDQKRDR